MQYTKDGTIAIGIVFGLLPIVFIGLRVWARRLVGTHFGIDDWLSVVAMVFAVAMGVTVVVGAFIGKLGQHTQIPFGEHGEPIMYPALENYGKIRFAMQIESAVLLTFSKCSILFLYRRIFSPQTFRRVTDVAIGIVLAWGISITVATIFSCTPVSAIWEHFMWETPLFCVDLIPFFDAVSITDAATDLMILILPIPMIWKLQMPFKQKMALTGIFALGTFVMALSIARLIAFVQAGNKNAVMDVTYSTAPMFYWSLVEGSLAVVSTTLPTLRPLFWKTSQSIKNTITKGSTFGSRSRSRDRNKISQRSFQPSHRLADSNDEEKLTGFDSSGSKPYDDSESPMTSHIPLQEYPRYHAR